MSEIKNIAEMPKIEVLFPDGVLIRMRAQRFSLDMIEGPSLDNMVLPVWSLWIEGTFERKNLEPGTSFFDQGENNEQERT